MNAQQMYREAVVLGASPVDLVVRLYEKIIDDLLQVSEAIENNNIQARSNRIKHAILILGHLESSLDFEKGGKVARDLETLYKTLRNRLLYVQFRPSKPGITQLITDLLAVRDAWIQVERAENPRAAAVESVPDAVRYAGRAGELDHGSVDWHG